MNEGIRNDPTSHDRAPSHRRPTMPRAAEVRERLAAGETMGQIASSAGRTVATVRQYLLDHGWDSETAEPLRLTEQAPRVVEGTPPPEGGLCAEVEADLFYPEKGSANRGTVAEAKKVCGRCDIRAACLDWALANDERWGIYGGLSPRERQRIKKKAS